MNEPAPAPASLYERDFVLWTEQQAAALRDGRLRDLDIPNLLEEVESLGGSQHNALANRLRILLIHLAKVELQPERDGSRSWWSTIEEQLARIDQLLEASPSLRRELPERIEKAWSRARKQVAIQTGRDLTTIPVEIPARVRRNVDAALTGGEYEFNRDA